MSANVSVVIPLFNKAATVERAVMSAVRQTVQPQLIIVVDDGSTDEGPLRVARLSDARVRLLQQPNVGPGAARNLGVSVAHTPLVGFLDADDEWKPSFLEHVHALAARCPEAGIYCTAYEEIRPEDGRPFRHRFRAVPATPGGGIVDDWFAAMLGFPPVSSSSVVVRREALNAVGGFPEGERLAEDWDLWTRLALRYRMAFDPAVQAVYHREAEGRLMHTQRYDGRDTPLVRTLTAALKRGDIPTAPARSVRRFLAKHQLEIAKDCLARGDRILARQWIARSARLGVLLPKCARWWWRSR